MITGAKGQVGCELVQLCEERGLNYVAFDSKGLDITDEQAVMECVKREQPSVIINAAAYTAVDKAEGDPNAAFAVNAEGPKYLALAAKAGNAKLIHISTDYVFDGEKDGAYTIDDEPNPINVYGASKLAGELAVQTTDKSAVIIRVAGVFGIAGDNFVKKIISRARATGELTIVDDQFVGPTAAALIAEFAVLQLAVTKLKGLLHLEVENHFSWSQYAKQIVGIAEGMGVLRGGVNIKSISASAFEAAAKRPRKVRLVGVRVDFEHSLAMYIKQTITSIDFERAD
ncbi:dTDP-4-dehydrorhamnose reductase [uncultured Umboniibacter sp.]|uniref:dTDP-4-dehydrorhamnose reductase n=1 Tax=uncultured Umboniibacter sp. TaxID=1798917 RepID=UPI0026251CF5|nr:dTDP-4-dehydrorhamnose reductase [uncultured Umboniibacter sp.]